MRKCKLCNYEGEVNTFPKAGTIKGINYYRHLCSECYYSQKKNYKRQQKSKLVKFKKSLKCIRCGFSDHRALHFHHKDPTIKSFAIAQGLALGMSFDTLKLEIEKCEALCANCHAIEHYHDNEASILPD